MGEDVNNLIGESSIFTIPPRVVVATLSGITIRDDILFERDESFFVSVVPVSERLIAGENSSVPVTIVDDDGECVCVCVCERERGRERNNKFVCMCVCVCVCVNICVYVHIYECTCSV